MSSILVEAKVVGQRRAAPCWTVPDSGEQFGDSLTLRDLIRRVVQHEVAAFRERQVVRRLLRVLSPEEIRLGVEAGKIDSGGQDVGQEIDLETAVGLGAVPDRLRYPGRSGHSLRGDDRTWRARRATPTPSGSPGRWRPATARICRTGR